MVTDADSRDRENRKSTFSNVFTSYDSCVSWKSQLEHNVVLSITESEYIAIIEAIKEVLWFKGLLNEPGDLSDKW